MIQAPASTISDAVIAAVERTDLTMDPFPHLLLDEVFDDATACWLADQLPDDDEYLRHRSPDSVDARNPSRTAWRLKLDERAPAEPSRRFRAWVAIADELKLPAVRTAFLRAFADQLPSLRDDGATLKTGVRLYRDDGGSWIGPHTDGPDKLVTCIFYLPAGEEMPDCGTRLLAPRDPSFTPPPDEEYDHRRFYDREDLFTVARSLPYKRNSAMALARSPWTFHSVQIPRGVNARYSLMYRLVRRK